MNTEETNRIKQTEAYQDAWYASAGDDFASRMARQSLEASANHASPEAYEGSPQQQKDVETLLSDNVLRSEVEESAQSTIRLPRRKIED